MGEEGKPSVPRWLVITTAVVGLVTAVLIAATKYYEFHKARAEAAKAAGESPAEKQAGTPSEKVGPSGTAPLPKPADAGFTVGSEWEGVTDPGVGIRTR